MANHAATANFADRPEPESLPKLPPGKRYGSRIGGWGPYAILDDEPQDVVGLRRWFSKAGSSQTK